MSTRTWVDTVPTHRVVIIEWLIDPDDDRTGAKLIACVPESCRKLFDLRVCASRNDVLNTISEVASEVPQKGVPILHIEAHGDDGPNGGFTAGAEAISWDEMRGPLSTLNVASGFNLLLVGASCFGLSCIFSIGIRLEPAPFVGCVGFIGKVSEAALLRTLKEFYTGILVRHQNVEDAVDQAQREIANTPYKIDFRSVRDLIKGAFIDIRKGDWNEGPDVAGLMASDVVVASLLAYDRFPQNRERFGIDPRELLLGAQS